MKPKARQGLSRLLGSTAALLLAIFLLWATNRAFAGGPDFPAHGVTTPTWTHSQIAARTNAGATQNTITSTHFDQCIIIDDAKKPQSASVYLLWAGTPTTATLYLYPNNVYKPHSIYLNGHKIGTAKVTGGQLGECSTDWPQRSWTFDPAYLVSGNNIISFTMDAGQDAWSVSHGYLVVKGNVDAGQIYDLTFTSSYDGSNQRYAVQKPPFYNSETPTPLMIILHGWPPSSDEKPYLDQIWAYGGIVAQKGWLLASPEMHGERPAPAGMSPGRRPLASRAAQHDVLDTISTVEQTYNVDRSRIYLVGESAGSQVALVTAAKHPDVFAALVDYAGPTDLTKWYNETELWRRAEIRAEVGGPPEMYPFEYQRRSPISYAANLMHLPTLIIHGTEDTKVLPHHAQDMYNAMVNAGSQKVGLYWYPAGHSGPATPYDMAWALDRISTEQKPAQPPRYVHVRTDENNSYWWFDVNQHTAPHWTDLDLTASATAPVLDGVISDTTYAISLTLNLRQLSWPITETYRLMLHNPVTAPATTQLVTPTLVGTLRLPIPKGKSVIRLMPISYTPPPPPRAWLPFVDRRTP